VIKGDTFAAALHLAAAVLQSRGEVAAQDIAQVVIACYKGIDLAEQHLREEAAGRAGARPGGAGGDRPSLRRE
jgi:hypothetical protein